MLNRSAFELAAERAAGGASQPVALIILDIYNVRMVNIDHGHLAGTKCSKWLSSAFVRRCALVTCWGVLPAMNFSTLPRRRAANRVGDCQPRAQRYF